MATTKRLIPTGVNMSIPEFTEKPDQRVNSTALGQLADAVNSISDNIRGNYLPGTLDLNDFYQTGFYNIGSTAPANCPVTWSQLIVNAAQSSNSGCVQILINEITIYTRRHTGNPIHWTNWNKQYLYDVDWVTLEKDGSNSFAKYKVRGNTVTVLCRHKVSSAAINKWENYVFGSIPSEYRPTTEDCMVPCVTDRSEGGGCALVVGKNGNIYIAGRWSGASDTGNILNAVVTYTL